VVHLAPEPWLYLNRPQDPGDARRGVLCVWHDALMIPTFAAVEPVRRMTCCLVSQHQDGSFLAEAMDFLGYTTVRGSTKRGGAKAVKQLLDDTAGKHIVITPDGPRGPRRQLKPGAIYVASQTGRPIVVGAYACRSGWRVQGRWTDMLIPRPFTTVYCVISSPIEIPPELSRGELDRYVSIVQAALDDLTEQTERLARGEIQQIEFAPAVRQRAAA
jgi:lysophospholipid acyltransferase (LPLAT)-like uncharacterized protein